MLLRRPRPLPRPHRVARNNGVRPQCCALARDDAAGGGRERARLGRAGAREAVAEVEVGGSPRLAARKSSMRSNASSRRRARRARASGRRGHGWGGRCRCPIVEPVNAHEPPRAVVFDFNGTISDDEPLLAELCTLIFARDRDRSHRGALLQRVRRLLRPRDRRARSGRRRPPRPGRRAAACSTAAPSSTSPAPGRARPCTRRSRHACARSPTACRSRSPPAPSARRSRPCSRAAACCRCLTCRRHGRRRRPREARPGGLPDRARPARRPRCRRAVVRGHPLRRHGGGRRRDAVRRRGRHGVGRPASRRRGRGGRGRP